MGRIVVGVDGSPASKRALAWAADAAALRDAEVLAVHAYRPPDDYSPYLRAYVPATAEALEHVAAAERHWREQRHAVAREQAESLLRVAAEGILNRDLGTRVELLAIEDSRPARALLGCAQGADLLVVGSRGRGGFSGLLLGSVSQHCAQHAPCPVVIIRPPG